MDTYSYIYDTRGNMSEMPHLDNMKWNISNELYKTENGTMEAYYQYSGGQRIRKWVDKGSIKEERIYLGSFEIYRKFEGSSLKVERQTVHVSDDSGRIAMLEKRTFGLAADDNNTAATLVRYIYSNHLQSASLELDDNADIISYEEYHPYGTTSYQAMNASINAVAKRYRYTGKERDEESGLYYHGARYYVPWLARWSAVDALESEYTPQSPYVYCSNNPVNRIDEDGMSDDDPQNKYDEGEKRTRAMFQAKLNEVANSKAYSEFKEWFADIGLDGLILMRDVLYQEKVDIWQNSELQRKWYGSDPDDPTKANLPYETRKKFWNEAISETVPTLKTLWASQKSNSTSGTLFNYYKNLTISNREEGWNAITSAGLKIGTEFLLHLLTGGARGLRHLGRLFPKSSVWELPSTLRGFEIEKMLGGNLPFGFKTIDKFEKGIATSIKSVDLTASTYSNTSKLNSLLKGYVDKVSGFEGYRKAGVEITKDMIKQRELVVAIQQGKGTKEQMKVINEIIEYGKKQGVNVIIKKIK